MNDLMKKLRYFILVPLLSFGNTGQQFRVKLIDYTPDKIPAGCGYFAFAVTLKFELLQNIDTLKQGQHILVTIYCPREYGINNYINNQPYTLTTYGDTKEDREITEYNWLVISTYEDQHLPHFWCKNLDFWPFQLETYKRPNQGQ
jgi:hypothetical protein